MGYVLSVPRRPRVGLSRVGPRVPRRPACPASARVSRVGRVPSIVEEWKYASAGRSSQGEMERRMVAQTAQKTYCIDTAEGQRRNRRSLHFGRDDKV